MPAEVDTKEVSTEMVVAVDMGIEMMQMTELPVIGDLVRHQHQGNQYGQPLGSVR